MASPSSSSTSSLSLTHQLSILRHSSGNSTLFAHHHLTSNGTTGEGRDKPRPLTDKDLSYVQCWQVVAEHQRWLERTVDKQLHGIINSTGDAIGSSGNVASTKVDAEIRDVVVGYLADNSPDLLLSVLACMNLTIRPHPTAPTSATVEATYESKCRKKVNLLPAMINGRWTPLEIERALRPSYNTEKENHVYLTILLYGLGYEAAAKKSVCLINQQNPNMNPKANESCKGSSHVALALSLPELAAKHCYCTNVNLHSNFSNSIIHGNSSNLGHPIDKDIGQSTTQSSNDISNADALLLFTSGTSSPSGAKGVRLSHRSLLVQAYAKTKQPCRYDSQTSVVATTVPWFHVGGMSSALSVILAGGTLVFPPMDDCGERKGFQPDNVLQSLMQPVTMVEQISAVIAANTLVVVPAMLHAIVEYAAKKKNNGYQLPLSQTLPNVRLILVGGQSIGNGRLYRDTRRLFPKARIVQTYACTEAASSITFEDLGWKGDGNDYESIRSENDDTGCSKGLNGATCVGTAPQHIRIGVFDVKAVSEQTEMPPLMLPHGQMGIIATKGPHVMSGYWNRGGNSTNTNNSRIDWMFTNDLGYIHPRSGKLFFCGRANDVIRTGGESVLATEVERILGTHVNIRECAIFALPDDKFGETVSAAIVLNEYKSPDSDNPVSDVVEDEQWTILLRRYCAKHQLAGFKRPRRVFCMRALPRNSSGKVLKHVVVRLCAYYSKERSRL